MNSGAYCGHYFPRRQAIAEQLVAPAYPTGIRQDRVVSFVMLGSSV